MKLNKLLPFVLLLLPLTTLGQKLVEPMFYLKNKLVSTSAKDFYYNKFKAADNKRTTSIIDSIRTKNDSIRPFYLYLVSEIMENSDGALSEYLGNSVKSFLELNPNAVVDFLYSDNKMVNDKFKFYWAKAIAGEFMITCETKEKQCVKSSLLKTLTKTSTRNRSKLKSIYYNIEKYCR